VVLQIFSIFVLVGLASIVVKATVFSRHDEQERETAQMRPGSVDTSKDGSGNRPRPAA
jgi:hypothetical protein